MELTTEIKIRKAVNSRINEVDFDHLEFGKYVSDHMLICDFKNGEWQEPLITPFANLALSPTALCLHYGQTVFEGMKAFRMQDGAINIFRMHKYYGRFVRSLTRMCMAVPPKVIFAEGLRALVKLDRAWVPKQVDSALYLRPFVIATEARFGVKVSSDYRFIIFTGPVGTLYADPIKVKVETEYIRAARGGTGYAKCGGNYGGSYFPTQQARKEGYDQVLWTDARDNKFIEESGMMNVMFVIDGKLLTAPLSDTILDGITRESLLILAKDLGYEVEERSVSIEELEKAFRNNSITEAFGAGTAAVVAPIKTINIKGSDFHLPDYTPGNLSHKLKNKLESIRTGREEDSYNWNFIV
jgi:branched-chain amino acid aminotransferase